MFLLLAAQAAVVDAAGDVTFLGWVLITVAGVVAGGIVWLCASVASHFRAKASLGWVNAAIAKAAELVHGFAAYVLEGLKPDLRAAFADGKVDQKEFEALLDKLWDLIKSHMKEKGFKDLEAALAVAGTGVTAYLRGLAATALQAKITALQAAEPPPAPAPAALLPSPK